MKMEISLDVRKNYSIKKYTHLGGGYGTDIYHCEHHDGLPLSGPVILKCLRGLCVDKDHKMLCREALTWQCIHHRFILPFLGIDDKTFPSYYCLVSPFLENKTIMD